VSAIELAVRLTFVPAGPIVLDSSGRPRFPVLPTQPAVYRLTFTGVGPDRVYIGQTDNTRREVVPGLVELEVAVPRLSPAVR
jgi:hypothetical protein